MKVYCISGVGADGRVFKNLSFPPQIQPVHLDWFSAGVNDDLSSYAKKLSESIDDSESFALLGLSMGGMLAIEIAGIKKPSTLIIISSISASTQLPFYYRWLGALKMHQWVPISLFTKASFIKRLFTAETKEDKNLVRNMIRTADPQFIRWSLGAILGWKRETKPVNLVHIHGSQDYLLPIRFVKPTHIIKKGGHLMILTRAKEISSIIQQALIQN